MRRAILHLGMGKTGSSTLQVTLSQNRQALGRLGYLYPDLGDGRADHNLLLTCFGPSRLPRILAKDRPPPEAVLGVLDAALAASHCHTMVLSSEFLFYMLEHELERLREFLEQRFADITVVAYLRDPCGYYVASQQQRARASSVILSPAEHARKFVLREKVALHLGIWGSRLRLRVFDRNRLAEGCVGRDFLTAFLPDAAAEIAVVSRNESLSAEAICAMQILRRHLWAGRDDQFDESTHALLRHLLLQQAELGGQTSPRLRPAIGAYLRARLAADLRWLEETVGIAFPGMDPIAPDLPEPEGWHATAFRELLVVDRDEIERTLALLVGRLQADAIRRAPRRPAPVRAAASSDPPRPRAAASRNSS